MKKLIILIGIFTSCASLNESKTSLNNYNLVKNMYPNHSVKEFKRFSYIFDVYNSKDSIKVFINSKGLIYKTIKLK